MITDPSSALDTRDALCGSLCFSPMQDKRACKNTIARDRARDKYVAGRKSKYATARYIAITDLRSWVDRPLTSVPVFDQQGTGTGIRCAKVPAAYRHTSLLEIALTEPRELDALAFGLGTTVQR